MNHQLVRDMDWTDLDVVGESLGRESDDPDRDNPTLGREHPEDMKVFVERLLRMWVVGRRADATRHARAYLGGVYPEGATYEMARRCVTFDFSAALAGPGSTPKAGDDLIALAEAAAGEATT